MARLTYAKADKTLRYDVYANGTWVGQVLRTDTTNAPDPIIGSIGRVASTRSGLAKNLASRYAVAVSA